MGISLHNKELAKVQFLKWIDLYLTEKPFQIFFEIPYEIEDQRQTNLVFKEKDIAIQNIRGREEQSQLDKHGFIIRRFSKGAACLASGKLDENTVQFSYFPAVQELLKTEVEDVDRAFLLDRRVRKLFADQYQSYLATCLIC